MSAIYECERLFLRQVELNDSEIIAKWKDEPLMREMSIGLDTNISVENQESDIKKSLEQEQPYYIIIEKASEKPIGYVRVNWMDNTNNFAWLRFGLGEKRGNGYSKEALRCFIKELFKQGTHRIDAEVYEYNVASHKILLSLGFKHEGTRRDANCKDGKFFDVHTLGLLATEEIK